MDGFIDTMKGERPLDTSFTLWFVLAFALGLASLGLQHLIGQTNAPGLLILAGILLAIVQIAVVFFLGAGVLRSAHVSDKPNVYRYSAMFVVAIAMIRVAFSYGEVAVDFWQTSPITQVAAREARVEPIAVEPVRDAKGLTAYQSSTLADARKGLPIKLNEMVTFSAVDVADTKLIYTFEVDAIIENKADLRAVQQKQMPGFCERLKSLYRPAEIVSIRHNMRFTDGSIAFFDIDMSDCRNTEPGKSARAPGPGNFITQFEDESGIDLAGVPDF